MEFRAIPQLANLSKEEFFQEMSNGLELIATNVKTLHSDSLKLHEMESYTGSNILNTIASEEAGKFLILMDAIRCPWSNKEKLSKQLKYFYSHLAKGIYSEYCEIRPSHFSEVSEWINIQRESIYLDGPNDVDWIFRNRILDEREKALYVDFIKHEDGQYWHSPSDFGPLFDLHHHFLKPKSIELVLAMDELKLTKVDSLGMVSEYWNSKEMEPNFTWQELCELNIKFLEKLNESGSDFNTNNQSIIVNKWLFPIFSLELDEIKIKKADLQNERDNWSPY